MQNEEPPPTEFATFGAPGPADDEDRHPNGALGRLGAPRFRAGASGVGLEVLPDARRFVAGLPDHRIGLFCAETGNLLRTYRGNADGFLRQRSWKRNGSWARDTLGFLCLSPDGRSVWSVGDRAWRTDIESGDATVYDPWDARGPYSRLHAANGSSLAVLHFGSPAVCVVLYDLDSRSSRRVELPSRDPSNWHGVLAIALSRDAQRMAFVLRPTESKRQSGLVLVDLGRRAVIEVSEVRYTRGLHLHFATDGALCVIEPTRDGSRLLRYGPDGKALREWALDARFHTYRSRLHLQDDGAIVALARKPEPFTPQRRPRPWTLCRIDASNGCVRRTECEFESPPQELTFCPDGERVMVRDDGGIVRAFGVDGRAATTAPTGHLAPIAGAAYSPDGRYIVSGDATGGVCCWRADTHALLWQQDLGPRIRDRRRVSIFDSGGPGQRELRLGFSADSASVFGAFKVPITVDGVRCWSIESGEPLPALPTGTEDDSIYEQIVIAPGSSFGAFLTLRSRTDTDGPDRACDRVVVDAGTDRRQHVEVRHLVTGALRATPFEVSPEIELQALEDDGETVRWSQGGTRRRTRVRVAEPLAPRREHTLDPHDLEWTTLHVVRPGIVWRNGRDRQPFATDMAPDSVILVASSAADGSEVWRRDLSSWNWSLSSACGPRSVRIIRSGDGTSAVLLANWPRALLFDPRTGAFAEDREGAVQLYASLGAVTIAAFSPDARRIVVGGDDGTLLIYDVSGETPGTTPSPAPSRTDGPSGHSGEQ